MNKFLKIRIRKEHEDKFFIISPFISLLCNTYVEYLLTSYDEERLKGLTKELYKRGPKERKKFLLELLEKEQKHQGKKTETKTADLRKYEDLL